MSEYEKVSFRDHRGRIRKAIIQDPEDRQLRGTNMVLGREFNVYGENTGNTIMIEKTQVMDSEPARYNPHTGEMESLHPEDTRAESGETRAR